MLPPPQPAPQSLIKQYSEFISFPIKLWTTSSVPEQVGAARAGFVPAQPPLLAIGSVLVQPPLPLGPVRVGAGCRPGTAWARCGSSAAASEQAVSRQVGSCQPPTTTASRPTPVPRRRRLGQVEDEEATKKAQEEADKKAAEEGKEAGKVSPGGRGLGGGRQPPASGLGPAPTVRRRPL